MSSKNVDRSTPTTTPSPDTSPSTPSYTSLADRIEECLAFRSSGIELSASITQTWRQIIRNTVNALMGSPPIKFPHFSWDGDDIVCGESEAEDCVPNSPLEASIYLADLLSLVDHAYLYHLSRNRSLSDVSYSLTSDDILF